MYLQSGQLNITLPFESMILFLRFLKHYFINKMQIFYSITGWLELFHFQSRINFILKNFRSEFEA